MPQLEFGTYISQIFWLGVSFFILYYYISKKFIPIISELIEKRQEQIGQDFSQATFLKKKADDLEDLYNKNVNEAQNKADEILNKALESFKTESDFKHQECSRKIAEIFKNSNEELFKKKQKYRKDVEALAIDYAINLVNYITGETPNKGDLEKYINK